VRTASAMIRGMRALRVSLGDIRHSHAYYAGQSAEGFSARLKKLVLLRGIVGWRVPLTGFQARGSYEHGAVVGDTPRADHQVPIDACLRCGLSLPVARADVLAVVRIARAERDALARRLEQSLPGARRIAGIHAWAQVDRKRWPLENYAAVAKH